MSPLGISLCVGLFLVVGSQALSTTIGTTTVAPTKRVDSDMAKNIEKLIVEAERNRKIKIANRIQDTLKKVKQGGGALEESFRNNFLHTLYKMANSTAITGSNVSRAAGTVIRGFVQDQFNLVSIAFYFPRLIFLDGPSQFIETLRLLRTNQIRAPMNMNEALDTLINFAAIARESQITMNVATPFLAIWPNIFRGSELLATEVLFSVFQWLGPIGPADVSAAAVEGLWNRWDVKASTTSKYDYDKVFRQKVRDPTNIPLTHQAVSG